MPLRHADQIREEPRILGELGPRVFRGALIVGALGVILAVILGFMQDDGFRRFAHSYVVSYCFFISLSLGSLFVVGTHHLLRGGWGVVVRRYAEIYGAVIPWLAIGALPVIFFAGALYEWTDPQLAQSDQLLQVKLPWLNMPFFIVRLAIYFLVWTTIALYFHRNSVRQDSKGDPDVKVKLLIFSGPAMLFGALTLTFFAFDVLMSLDYKWFSTMFGVYFFAGAAVGGVALVTVTATLLQRKGILRRAITSDHYHDLGKLMLSFTLFWAYIAFSQYMLIWYANLPEETEWFLHRQQEGWSHYYLILLLGCFVLPFGGLLPRKVKRRRNMLVIWAGWILLLRWFDLYWIVMPEYDASRIPFHLMDVSLLVGLGGLFIAAATGIAGQRSLIPERDPRLTDSLRFENV